MNKRSVLALLALTLVILSLPSTAQAENVFQFSSGRSTDAGFSSTDPSGCIQTGVITVAFDGKFRTPPEAGGSFSEVFINIRLTFVPVRC
jgi:hypothetical protein